MAVPTMIKIINEISIALYGGTEVCNCPNCRRERADEHEGRLLLQIAPSLSQVPLRLDRQNNYNRYSPEFKYYDTEVRQKKILGLLKDVEQLNKIFKKEHLGSTIKTCINCGLFHTPKYKHTIVHENKKYFLCSTCVKDYEKCGHCNTLQRDMDFDSVYKNYEDHMAYNNGEKISGAKIKLCSHCFQEYYKKCDLCKYIQVSNQFIVLLHPSGSVTACNICCEKNKVPCYTCGKDSYTFLDIYESHTVADRYYCIACSENRIPIHNYTYKPFFQHFHSGLREGKVSSSALHFGFELEIERYASSLGRITMAEIVKDKCGTDYIYVVQDSSIDEGIEVVSHPFTWSEYKENIDRWTNLLLFIRTKEWKANRPKVGFHVHMTKAAFTTFHLFKFLKFFYREHNKDFICVIAQRQPTSFSRFTSSDKLNIIANAKDKANRTDDHYNAVNLNNKNTVEVRVFRGTLEPLYFHKNIEFLHAVFKYSRDYSPKQMEYISFINYVQQHHKLYPCLWEFLTNNIGIKTEMLKERKV